MNKLLFVLLFIILSCQTQQTQQTDNPVIQDLGFENTETVYDDTGKPAFYVVNTDSTFLILSASYATKPVIGYGDGNLDVHNIQIPAMRYLFDQWKEQIGSITSTAYPNQKWSDILDGSSPLRSAGEDPMSVIGPLVEAEWHQGTGWNSYCPEDPNGPGGHTYAGCVAVAMAQVMHYWKFPESGTQLYCYVHSTYGEQCADFANTVYTWDRMPNDVPNEEIARLLYHTGVSMNMNYSPYSSGASTNLVYDRLIRYFGYDPNSRYEFESMYTGDWIELLVNELENGRPIIYRGYDPAGGHAFVVDGFNYQDSLFHVNWGWGGSWNGWYNVYNLNPYNFVFDSGMGANIGVKPLGHNAILTMPPIQSTDVYPDRTRFEWVDRGNSGGRYHLQVTMFRSWWYDYSNAIDVDNLDKNYYVNDGFDLNSNQLYYWRVYDYELGEWSETATFTTGQFAYIERNTN